MPHRESVMQLRSYQPGDETSQVEIYNEAAGHLPKFKPATVEDVRRRCREPGFDPAMRVYAEEDGRIVGYVAFNADGRVGHPWCRKGHERAAEMLFQHAIQAMR